MEIEEKLWHKVQKTYGRTFSEKELLTQKIINITHWDTIEKFTLEVCAFEENMMGFFILSNSSIWLNKIILSDKIRKIVFYSKEVNCIFSVDNLPWDKYKTCVSDIKNLLKGRAYSDINWKERQEIINW